MPDNRITTFSILKKKIKNKSLSFGFWFQASNADTVECLTYNKNIDWAVIDLEHGSIKKSEITNIFRALELNRVSPLIRIDINQANEINNYLDLGAHGVILSNLNNSSELEYIKNKISFSLRGGRGNGFYRANNYGKNFNQYMQVFKDPIIIPMIENTSAVDDLENILNISDCIFIGPYDLSNSLGYPGNFKHKLFKNTLKTILNLCKKKRKNPGVHCVSFDKKLLNSYKKNGFKFIAYSMDTLIYKEFDV